MDQRVRLGASPLSVTRLGVGCWSWGDREFWRYEQDHGPHDVVEAFDACLTAGLDLFDTAESYGWGKSEQIVGALARRCGRNVTLATKYAPLAGRGGPAAIARGIAGSLRRLGREQIDLYQIHWADRDEVPIGPTMSVLADAVAAGTVRAVGVSNFNASEMRMAHAALAARGVALATNQVRYSLLHRAPEVDGVLDACRELDITLLAYSPLEQGLLAGHYSSTRLPIGKRAATPWFAPENVNAAAPVLALLHELAARRAVDPAAIALAWLLRRPGVVPLAGAKTGSQARANATALTVTIDDDEVARLDRATIQWRNAPRETRA